MSLPMKRDVRLRKLATRTSGADAHEVAAAHFDYMSEYMQ